jgi:hypothetical protein
MTAPVADALPYGIRDAKLTPYTDAQGTVLDNESIDLPNMQTLSFSEKEEFQELRGDDKLITTRGKGAQVDWSLEAGGIAIKAWAVMSGGSVIETGITPNRKIVLRKKSTDSRPFFRIDGRIVSDSGGDVQVRIYRCRCNDAIQGDFKDGEFFVTSVSGVGLPLLDDVNDLLYDIIRYETSQVLSLTPEANPIPSPMNLTAGTKSGTSPTISQVLTWNAVTGATAYSTQKSTDGGTTWVNTTVQPSGTAVTVTETGLSTGAVQFRVRATVGGINSDYSPAISLTL